MKTYQDLLEQDGNERKRQDFIMSAIYDYKASEQYYWAQQGEAYAKQQNSTIMHYKKILYTMTGQAVPDNFSANFKCASGFYKIFQTQENQYLLSNGVNFNDANTKGKLETKRRKFDTQIQKAGKSALNQGCAYGFWNFNHVDVFDSLEFAPLYDEEDGALKAGIRWWQLADDKPMRMTLYELDGYTEYIYNARNKTTTENGVNMLQEKRSYKQIVKQSVAEGVQIFDGGNYAGFPIVPLWANPEHVCGLIGLKENIDCYDLIKSGFANDLDEASLLYWTLENCGGMDDLDLIKFIEHMHTVKAAVVDGGEGAKAEAHTVELPYQARETGLNRIEDDLYRDGMAVNTTKIAAGNVTATQIKSAYNNLDSKTDEFEYCVIEFICGLLELAGVDDEPSFVRSRIINETEETNMVLSAGTYLDDETVLKHLPFLSPDEVEDIMKRKDAENAELYGIGNANPVGFQAEGSETVETDTEEE